MSIPKIIHYCWFGGGEKPDLVLKSIESWKKYCPDFEIVEWNEENFDITKNEYIRGAYENNRWGFVSDYVRCFVVEKYGGVYFDTDVELIKPIDKLLKYDAFFATEDGEHISTGLGFGAKPRNAILGEIIKDYDSISYYRPNGKEDLTACPVRNTEIIKKIYPDLDLRRKIVKNNIIFLPPEYFCPLDYNTGKLHISERTYGIHHFSGSWQTPFEKWRRGLKRKSYRLVKKILGGK